MTPEEVRQIIREELSRFLKIDRFLFEKNLQIFDGKNIQIGGMTGTKIGTAAAQKIAFHNATPVIQASHIADPSGGGSAGVDTPARNAINAILVVLENKGFIATS